MFYWMVFCPCWFVNNYNFGRPALISSLQSFRPRGVRGGVFVSVQGCTHVQQRAFAVHVYILTLVLSSGHSDPSVIVTHRQQKQSEAFSFNRRATSRRLKENAFYLFVYWVKLSQHNDGSLWTFGSCASCDPKAAHGLMNLNVFLQLNAWAPDWPGAFISLYPAALKTFLSFKAVGPACPTHQGQHTQHTDILSIRPLDSI